MGHVFISYSHKDKTYVHQLQEALLNNGFEVWIDDHIDYGDEWPKIIQKHLDASDAFIVVMSKNSYESDMVQNEVTRAREKKKNIFPLLLNGDAWLIFQAKQYMDVTDESLPSEKFYERLASVTPRKAKDVAPEAAPPTIEPPPKVEIAPAPSQKQIRRTQKSAQKNLAVATIASVLIGAILWGASILFQLKPTAPQITSTATKTFTATPSLTLAPTSASTNLPTETVNQNAQMALVPAGNFIMGSDDHAPEEKPAHKVFLDNFYIDKNKITNALYKLCVDEKVCQPPKFSNSYLRPTYYGDARYAYFPVMGVDWYMAKTYCKWRDARLPTEAEWEKAARGTDERVYPWGNEIDQSRANYNYNNDPNFVGDTSKVGSYPSGASPYDVYDMAGNIWDWTADMYAANYYATLPNIIANPLGPDLGQYRVIRGGSWNSAASSIRSSRRSWNDPSNANVYIGFRCAKNP